MKKLIKIPVALLLGVCLVTAPRPAAAQFATMDVPHIGVQLTEFAKKAQDWMETLKNYEVVRDAYAAAQTANDISTNIKAINDQVRSLTSDGLNLQRQIQADLRNVQNIRSLRISNLGDIKTIASNISGFTLGNYMPSLGQTQRFTNAMASAQDADAGVVKDIFNTVSTESGTTRNVRQSDEQKSEAAVTMLAVENNNQQQKIATAFRYKKTADELTAQAIELQDGVNTNSKFTMTDGERLLVQAQAANTLVRAQEFREKAETLLAEAARKGPAQKATETVMHDQNFVAGMQGMLREQMPTY
jgi:hypothetical protein